MFATVEVHITFEIADEAEARGLIAAARRLAFKKPAFAGEDPLATIADAREALHRLMTEAATSLPINTRGVSAYAERV